MSALGGMGRTLRSADVPFAVASGLLTREQAARLVRFVSAARAHSLMCRTGTLFQGKQADA